MSWLCPSRVMLRVMISVEGTAGPFAMGRVAVCNMVTPNSTMSQ